MDTQVEPPAAELGPPVRAPRTVDGERLIAVFRALVEPIGASLPAHSEVVLHDLSRLPHSIVAIHGDVTGRRVGDPATDLLLEKAVSGTFEHQVGYETVLPDGRRLKCSTMVIRDIAGTPVAALCINSDLSAWYAVQQIAAAMLGEPAGPATSRSSASDPTAPPDPAAETGADDPAELFVHDVDELAAHLVRRAVKDVGVPVELMHKQHKLQVVRDLKARGIFLLRDAVDMIAASLGVSRFTIYNYLNEINDAAEDTETTTGPVNRFSPEENR